jgi:TonB family protein
MLNPKLSLIIVPLVSVLLATSCNKPGAPAAPADAQKNQQAAQDPNASVPPRLLKAPKPEFPKDLWDKPGTVVVVAVVGIDGKVKDTKIASSPHQELNPLAIKAVKEWQFDPARRADKPVPSAVSVTVNFQPPSAAPVAGNPKNSR